MFISLPVAAGVKEEIRRIQNGLRAHLPDDAVKWTRPEQVHLTLKFLGNVAAERAGELVSVVREACDELKPVAMRAEGLAFFPSRGMPRVLWIGVRDEGDALRELQERVEIASRQILDGIEEERFTGHLTIGRAKNLRRAHARRLGELAAAHENKKLGSWSAEFVEVMRSELSAGGSRYTCLAEIPLAGAPKHAEE